MLPTYIRFRDLKERGIVDSWPQLKFMIDNYGFPAGRLASPQVRIWSEDEVADYLANPPFLPARLRGDRSPQSRQRGPRGRRRHSAGGRMTCEQPRMMGLSRKQKQIRANVTTDGR